MNDNELLGWCFQHFYGLDISNAAIHCANVRYSPITFRLAERLEGVNLPDATGMIQTVVRSVYNDKGRYPEDAGR